MRDRPPSLLMAVLLSFAALGSCWSRAGHTIRVPAQPRVSVPRCTLHSPFPPPDLPGAQVGVEGTELLQSSAWPVKVMVFIDGSWLYYSFHGRRPNCPVTARYGDGWEFSHRLLYDRLPQLISQHLHKEMLQRHQTQRFVEVVRTVVFSSARADTHYRSHRLRMFREMEAVNFEVHMSTTSGAQEKCIDISLAVEMMHYASVPGAYDIAVLLSGDKDFMPALARIRQKGKRIALCSMRNCCSRDLIDPAAHVRDFDPIWMDDHLGYLIQPDPGALAPDAQPRIASQLLKLCIEFLRDQGGCASSRDIGRHLQSCVVDGRDALSQLKEQSRGLRSFFSTFPESFEMSKADEDASPRNGAVGEFFVTLLEGADRETDTQEELLIDAKIGGAADRRLAAPDGGDEEEEERYGDEDEVGGGERAGSLSGGRTEWGARTVSELRAELRQRGLSTLGRKADLIERLEGVGASSSPPSRYGTATAARPAPSQSRSGSSADTSVTDTVVRYLEGCGGVASSRNVGRHLAAEGLLFTLKQKHAGLFHFLQKHDHLFQVVLPEERGALEYEVRLKRAPVEA